MQEVADWLNSLGMAEYAQRFAENDIDFSILGDLTDQTWKKSASPRSVTSPAP
jgi:SAM domain (Sterile alpha motif)